MITIASSGRPLTTTESLVLGAFLCLFGIAFFYGTWFHWKWMQKRLGWMLRWGNSGLGFPASRWGTSFGAGTSVLLGAACLANGIGWKPSANGNGVAIGAVIWMVLAVCVALRDYLLHRNNKDDDDMDQ